MSATPAPVELRCGEPDCAAALLTFVGVPTAIPPGWLLEVDGEQVGIGTADDPLAMRIRCPRHAKGVPTE